MTTATIGAMPAFSNAQNKNTEIVLSLPGIHCAGCIGRVEKTLMSMPGVKDARVNLTSKRVTIDSNGIEPETFVDVLAANGYEAHPLDRSILAASTKDTYGRALLLKVAVAGFAMMNVMAFSVAVWSGASHSTQVLFHWLSAAIAVPSLVFSAQVFVRSAYSALRVGRFNMDVPISVAIILAAFLSVLETTSGGSQVYFDAALSLTFFLLIGRYLDHRTRYAARSASQELSALEVPRATLWVDGVQTNVDVCDLKVGDTIVVAAGMRVPVDGTVTSGNSDLDRSLLTGESRPVGVEQGEGVSAGELNLSAPLRIVVTATGDNTSLRRMAALVETAETARNRYTALADRAAKIYAPAVHLLALAAFIGWVLISGDALHSLRVAISVLIITCPCALGLAAPAVITAATGRLFRRGLLVKNGTALERLAEIDAVVFDKTGTLTTGHALLESQGLDENVLGLLAALSQSSEHPVSRAISGALPAGIVPARVSDIVEIPGKGIKAHWNGQTILLGKASWVGGANSPSFRIGGQEPIDLDFRETLKSGAEKTIADLTAAGFAPRIFSGDSQEATDRLASQLGNLPAVGDMTPDEKHKAIREIEESGKRVLMVGDGLNDLAALTAAHASMSPASALDASRAGSDIVILGPTLEEIPEAIRVSRSARKRVIENFAIAAAYNAIAIPLALVGLATPLTAAIAMSASSITVLLNALRVR